MSQDTTIIYLFRWKVYFEKKVSITKSHFAHRSDGHYAIFSMADHPPRYGKWRKLRIPGRTSAGSR